MIFLETSAKTGDGVAEVFLKCARTIQNKISTGVLDATDAGTNGVQQIYAPHQAQAGSCGC